MRTEIAILGAGIAGSALAYYLSQREIGVTLVDRGASEVGATGRSAGFLTTQHWNDLDNALTRATQGIAAKFLGEGPEGFHRSGFLRVTRDEADLPTMEARRRTYAESGISVELLDRDALETRFSALDVSGLVAGLYTPEDGYVDPYDFSSSFLARAKAAGMAVLPRTSVTGLRIPQASVEGVETAEGFLKADRVVLALGARIPGLLRAQGVVLALKPYRAQALVTAPLVHLPDVPMVHELPEGYYFRRDRDGLLLGDGTEEREADPSGYNDQADFRLYAEMAEWISRRLPAVKNLELARGWAGLCVGTPDRFPLVGPVPEVEGLYVFGGFNGLGIMRAPPLAEALAEELLDGRPAVDLGSLRPDRFPELEEFPIREGFTLSGNAGAD